jgi:hypothetical protein
MVASMARATNSTRTTAGRIDRTKVEHVAYLNEQKKIFSEASDYFVAETNETERALCAQLMLVDTVLLTGTLVAIGNKDLLDLVSSSVRAFIMIAIVALVASIGCGIKYYFAVMTYNKKWAFAKHSAMKAFLDNRIQTWHALRRKTDGYQVGVPNELDSPWLKGQIYLIGFAALLYLVALFGLLFNVHSIFS